MEDEVVAMATKLKAYSISFLLHIFLLSLLLFIASRHIEDKKVIEIDLSFIYPKEENLNIKQEEKGEISQPIKERQREEKREIHQQKFQEVKQEPIVKEERVIREEQQKAESLPQKHTPSMENYNKGEKNPSIPIQTTEMVPSGHANSSELQKSKLEISQKKSSDGTSLSESPRSGHEKSQSQEIYLREKLSVISSIVQKHITYPPLARRMGWMGRVIVSFTLHPDGRLEELRVEKSSGYELLDKNALDTVKRVAHLFPTPPVEVVVKLPINYELK